MNAISITTTPVKKSVSPVQVSITRAVAPIGPSMRNLNIEILEDSQPFNQLDHLQTLEYIASVDATAVSSIPDYKDETLHPKTEPVPISKQLCPLPQSWWVESKKFNRDFDFRFETSSKILTFC